MPFQMPVNGCNVQLTLDLEYQSILEEELYHRQIETKAIAATGIIMNPQTGEILARRWDPFYLECKNILDSGELGRIETESLSTFS